MNCNPTKNYQLFGKRLFDIIISIAALLLLTPVFYFLIVLICIDTPGGAFFTQARIGQGMKKFKVFKFRSMSSNSLYKDRQFEPGSQKRVTRIGKIIRKIKLDELPELINVLKGDMSIVGPRPEVEKYVNYYKDEYENILDIKPGLTDWASILFRNEEFILSKQPFPEKHYLNVILPQKLDLAKQYQKNITFENDIKIIIRTIKAIFH